MTLLLNSHEPAIVRGIKTVGVGKRGSKNLTPELAQEIAADLKAGTVSPVAAGAFFGGLFNKGVVPAEMALEQAFVPGAFKNYSKFIACLAPEAPLDIQNICVRLLQNETLDFDAAYRLGKFLLSKEPADAARGLAVSILRVRYETDAEYAGILKSLQETIAEPFRQPIPAGNPIVQLAEPFDGVDHSYLITPLLAHYVQRCGYRAVSLVGRNSGPKMGNNLLDLMHALQIPSSEGNHDLVPLQLNNIGRNLSVVNGTSAPHLDKKIVAGALEMTNRFTAGILNSKISVRHWIIGSNCAAKPSSGHALQL